MGTCCSFMNNSSTEATTSSEAPTANYRTSSEAPTANYRTTEIERVRCFTDLTSFTYRELHAATNNFQEKLGEGGFGAVYKGELPPSELSGRSMPTAIAVKRLSVASQQGIREFEAELRNFSRISHKNLVKLLGYCIERINKDRATRHIMIVYEFVANRSLEYLLHQNNNTNACKWTQRLNILRQVAQALKYLHEDLAQSRCILHRDIKPSNIMLDESYNPKLGDFGLSRMLASGTPCYETVAIEGTRGYMAPELYGNHVMFTKETDMYSFGVVLLEVATGKRPMECIVQKPSASQSSYQMIGQPLVEWVWALQHEGRLLEAADKRLLGLFEGKEMRRVLVAGLACCHPDPQARLSIGEVVNVLSGAARAPYIPSVMPHPLSHA